MPNKPTPRCPACKLQITPQSAPELWAAVRSDLASRAGRRQTPHAGPGRPRGSAERCSCGAMTLRLAMLRARKDGTGPGHLPGCSFFRE